MDDHFTTAAQELADWIERWRHETDSLTLVSPVAKAWLEFVDEHPELLGRHTIVIDTDGASGD